MGKVINLVKTFTKNQKIDLTSFGWQRIRSIEREYERGNISSQDVYDSIMQEDKIRLSLDGSGKRELQKLTKKLK